MLRVLIFASLAKPSIFANPAEYHHPQFCHFPLTSPTFHSLPFCHFLFPQAEDDASAPMWDVPKPALEANCCISALLCPSLQAQYGRWSEDLILEVSFLPIL